MLVNYKTFTETQIFLIILCTSILAYTYEKIYLDISYQFYNIVSKDLNETSNIEKKYNRYKLFTLINLFILIVCLVIYISIFYLENKKIVVLLFNIFSILFSFIVFAQTYNDLFPKNNILYPFNVMLSKTEIDIVTGLNEATEKAFENTKEVRRVTPQTKNWYRILFFGFFINLLILVLSLFMIIYMRKKNIK